MAVLKNSLFFDTQLKLFKIFIRLFLDIFRLINNTFNLQTLTKDENFEKYRPLLSRIQTFINWKRKTWDVSHFILRQQKVFPWLKHMMSHFHVAPMAEYTHFHAANSFPRRGAIGTSNPTKIMEEIEAFVWY